MYRRDGVSKTYFYFPNLWHVTNLSQRKHFIAHYKIKINTNANKMQTIPGHQYKY